MSLLIDRHRVIVSPALVPTQSNRPEERRQNDDAVITVGLINNMPDAALQSTERQIIRLIRTAAGRQPVRLHCFSLPSVKRSPWIQSRVDARYTDIAELSRLQIDGLFVTGAEPRTARLKDEAFWNELTEIVDWAKTNTRSTIWSCLAAHAAVLHLDSIERHPRGMKCSGIFDCLEIAEDRLTQDLPRPFKVPHSRMNELRESDLTARGYQILTASREAGVDIFAKQFRSRFIFFQGHPEYDALSLQHEYLRDISRFLAGKQNNYPAIPVGQFDSATEDQLMCFQKRAIAERKPALSAEIPALAVRQDAACETAGAAIFRNWLGYLSDQKRLSASLQNRR